MSTIDVEQGSVDPQCEAGQCNDTSATDRRVHGAATLATAAAVAVVAATALRTLTRRTACILLYLLEHALHVFQHILGRTVRHAERVCADLGTSEKRGQVK